MMKTRATEKKPTNKIKMDISENVPTLESTSEVPVTTFNEIAKAKLKSGEYKFSSKRGRSKIWAIFARLLDDNGKDMEGIVGCKTCFNIYKFNKSSSNLLKHRCFRLHLQKTCAKKEDSETRKKNNSQVQEIDKETIKKGIHIVTEWTVKNGRPFSIIDDSGLKNLAEFLITVGAKFGQNVNIDKLLPHPTTVSRNLAKLYEFHFEEIKNDILKFTNFGYSITSDIWTDNSIKTPYLYLTIHYIKEGTVMNRLLAVKSLKEDSCDDETIKGVMKKVLHEFGCDMEKDNPTIVSDTFRGFNNIHCVNHLLHKVIERTINEVPELMNMLIRCNKIVEYLKESGLNSNLENPLKSYCPSSWNAMYYLFKSIESNWIDISNIFIEKNETTLIEEMDLSQLSSIICLLARFETSSKKLIDNNNPTLHLAIPYINHLKKICRIDINDVEVVQHCKGVLLQLLESVVLQSFSKYHNIALFLFPPTNKLTQFTETEKQQTIYDCWEVMKAFIDDSTTDNDDLLTSSKPEENDIFADFCEPAESINVYDNISNEIQRYQNMSIALTENFNILQWWTNNKEEFPYLYKASCKILAAPASSAASEKLFSTVLNLISDKRYKIATNEDMVNKIMFLHSNIEDLNENVLD